ncbi:YkvA family protein [Lunatimonas salinarum]|uniref:YkvA family protein n=1 Tax=Lunatimonas salinarum TaxID=1774590 RepID=UPI001AE01DEB|nr:YkvA family protein [Lunatimonas salinarum]
MNIKEEYHQVFEKAKAIYMARAQRIAASESKLKHLLHQVRVKISDLLDTPLVAGARAQLEIFVRMLTAHIKGEYKSLSGRSLGLLVLALFYFALPLDMVPDFIPFVGYVDDLSVLLGIYNSLKADIERFQLWEQNGRNTDMPV